MLRSNGIPRHRAEELGQLNELNWRYSEPARAGEFPVRRASPRSGAHRSR